MLTNDTDFVLNSYCQSIRELIIQLSTTTFSTAVESQKSNIIDNLKKLHIKLTLTQLVSKRSLLAITGLQGTGKTTIIKHLYNLPDELLPSNSSRGERLPVFITENDVKEITTFVYRSVKNVKGEINIEVKEIDVPTFNQLSLQPLPERDLWLECIVPYRYLYDKNKSIVLLPGFEKDKTDVSQLLLEHILYLSTSSVLVVRKDTYARESTQKMMTLVKEVYSSVKPIIAISFGNINEEQNEHFKEELITEFNVQTSQRNRVVITGIGPKYLDDWKKKLIDAINEYCYASNSSDNIEKKLLFNLVNEVDKSILGVRKLMDQEINTRQLQIHSETSTQQVLIQFEQSYQKILKEIETDIIESLSLRIKPATKELRTYLEVNSSPLKELRTKFVGQKPKELYELEYKIDEIWNNPNVQIANRNIIDRATTQFVAPNQEIYQVISKYIAREGKKVFDTIDEPKQETESKAEGIQLSPLLKKIQQNQQKDKANYKKELPLQRIEKYFADTDASPESLKRDDYKTLAVMGAFLIRESYKELNPQESQIVDLETSLMEKSSFEFNLVEGVENLSNYTPRILKSIPLILGVDGLIDGEFDLVNNAVTAIGATGLTITAGQLLIGLGIGFSVAYAGKAVQESMKKANERQLQLSQAGERVFNELPKVQAKAFVHSLQRVYERMADQLNERHMELSGKFDEIGELEKINYNIRRISQLTNELKRGKYEQSLFLPV